MQLWLEKWLFRACGDTEAKPRTALGATAHPMWTESWHQSNVEINVLQVLLTKSWSS